MAINSQKPKPVRGIKYGKPYRYGILKYGKPRKNEFIPHLPRQRCAVAGA
jgi:hypothetical protein